MVSFSGCLPNPCTSRELTRLKTRIVGIRSLANSPTERLSVGVRNAKTIFTTGGHNGGDVALGLGDRSKEGTTLGLVSRDRTILRDFQPKIVGGLKLSCRAMGERGPTVICYSLANCKNGRSCRCLNDRSLGCVTMDNTLSRLGSHDNHPIRPSGAVTSFVKKVTTDREVLTTLLSDEVSKGNKRRYVSVTRIVTSVVKGRLLVRGRANCSGKLSMLDKRVITCSVCRAGSTEFTTLTTLRPGF